LTGTHIGQYYDGKKYGLIDLMDDILAIGKDFRLRLSSLDPRDCSDQLLQRIETSEQICKHIHINVQSFSPEVLKGMNRHYKEYDLLIKRLIQFRNKYPYAGIGGDFIVGFPGETESMFETTLKTVEQVGFNYGHVFRYSKRPGTAAASMSNQIHEKEKTGRSNQLRKCLAEMRYEFINKQLNTVTHTIVVEQEKPIRGITSNYIRVEIPRAQAERNSWQRVILKKYLPEKNRCKAVLHTKEK
ncbi:radical SAM protein, partial [Fibrobacterota bacterium]